MKRANRVTRRVLMGIMIALALTGIALAAPLGKKIATVAIPVTPEQYASDPQPLTAVQCAQCHTGLFQNLKKSGGRHRFSCQNCHNQFHTYSPRKGNWDAIMPKCASCHEIPHGKKITECNACHSNPHTPRKIAASAQLTNFCFDCHGSVRDQLTAFPSKHTKVACAQCHTSHGFKPSCFACHKPHVEGQTVPDCLKCHPVHQPRQIIFATDTPSNSCGSCHTKVFGKLSKSTSKHKNVLCVTCHKGKHRYVPQCTDCHGKPHNKAFHDQFPRCLSCHIDVHDLPVMKSGSQKK
ncbi:MAG: cytochrome C [Desulfuromonadaceae bacterium]|nr:cytochrome C [Desulfuromonadaceae bacterium]MDD5106994.1 cytochrome C [Desulfuromonadaceae bacterium]